MPMWKPMAHSFSFTLDSSILDELKSQTLLRPPFWNVWKCKKLGNVNKIVCESSTLLATTKHGQSSWWIAHDWHPKHNMSSTKHVDDLKMTWYSHWIIFRGVRLNHIRWNWWACEPTIIASTYTHLSIQA